MAMRNKVVNTQFSQYCELEECDASHFRTLLDQHVFQSTEISFQFTGFEKLMNSSLCSERETTW